MNLLNKKTGNIIKQKIELLYFSQYQTYLELYESGKYIRKNKNYIIDIVLNHTLTDLFYVEIKNNYYEYSSLEVIDFILNKINEQEYFGIDSTITPNDFTFLIITNHDGDIFEISM